MSAQPKRWKKTSEILIYEHFHIFRKKIKTIKLYKNKDLKNIYRDNRNTWFVMLWCSAVLAHMQMEPNLQTSARSGLSAQM